MPDIEKEKPVVVESVKLPKFTKKMLAAENKVIHNFENMCSSIRSVNQDFILLNIKNVLKGVTTVEGKQKVADVANALWELAKTDIRLKLPADWQFLMKINN